MFLMKKYIFMLHLQVNLEKQWWNKTTKLISWISEDLSMKYEKLCISWISEDLSMKSEKLCM